MRDNQPTSQTYGPVLDHEALLRRIHPNHIDNGKPLALAFRDQSRQVSVDREGIRPLETLRAMYPLHSIGRLIASRCRAAGYDATPDPTLEDPAHALIVVPPTKHAKEASYELLALAEFIA